MFFVTLRKMKSKIYNKLIDFQIYTRNLSNQKIKYICLKKELEGNILDR